MADDKSDSETPTGGLGSFLSDTHHSKAPSGDPRSLMGDGTDDSVTTWNSIDSNKEKRDAAAAKGYREGSEDQYNKDK